MGVAKCCDLVGDHLRDRSAVGKFLILHRVAVGVAGAYEGEDAQPGIEIGLDGVHAHVGIDCDGIGTKLRDGSSVVGCGDADVASLGIEEDEESSVFCMFDCDFECVHPPAAITLKAGALGLDDADLCSHSVDHTLAEGFDCFGWFPVGVSDDLGDFFKDRIEADTDGRIDLVQCQPESIDKAGGFGGLCVQIGSGCGVCHG